MVEPGGVLGRIVARRRETLAAHYGDHSLDTMLAQAQPTRRSLVEVIRMPGSRFICEFKRASPSEGTIRDLADPVAIASAYTGVADAMSVLVEPHFFGGSLADLTAVRNNFDGPILAKDFLVDPRQIPEARAAGADAVLVMLSVLDDSEAADMISLARTLNMDVLVEVHDESEMERALALDAPLIGINNRDLTTLSIDLAVTERLAEKAADRLVVSESGILTREDVERLAPLVDGFLIGTSIMRSSDPADAIRELVFGRVKLCGLRSPEEAAAARPARYAGLMFVHDSPRFLTLEEAEVLIADLPPAVLPVGVFRNAPVGEVAVIAERLHLHAVQLHGEEDRAYRERLRKHLPPGTQIWQAIGVEGEAATAGHADADRLLFDSARAGRSGGLGESFDWTLLQEQPTLPEALLAGGIGVANARQALETGVHAIDVGSSVDERPGKKSPVKIAALFEALRPPSRKTS